MCLCNIYLQMVTAAVDVNQSEQFMEALNKELFSLAAVQKKKKKKKISWYTGLSAVMRGIKGLFWIYTIIAKNTAIARSS